MSRGYSPKKINCMSYPHGSYNKDTIQIAQNLDIKMPQLVIKALTLILRKNMSKRELKLLKMNDTLKSLIKKN